MDEQLLFSLEAILIDFFTLYGFSTILCLILFLFVKNDFLIKFDQLSTHFISLSGIVYIMVWIISTIVEINIADQETKTYLLNRIYGEYWFYFWLQPIVWFSITQLLRFTCIKKNKFLRLIFSFFLTVSIERIMLFASIFHRDYLPSSWTMYSGIYSSNFFIESVMRIFIFILFVGLFALIKQKINKWKIEKSKSQ